MISIVITLCMFLSLVAHGGSLRLLRILSIHLTIHHWTHNWMLICMHLFFMDFHTKRITVRKSNKKCKVELSARLQKNSMEKKLFIF